MNRSRTAGCNGGAVTTKVPAVRRTALTLATLAGLATLAACTMPGSGSPTRTSGAASASASSATPAAAAADGSAAHPLAFGQTWNPPGKMAITIGAPAPYTPSDSAFNPAGNSARAVVMDVSVTVPSSAPAAVPAMVISIQATAGDKQVQQIQDTANDIGSPTASIAPGKTLKWKVAFGLSSTKGELTVQVGALVSGAQDIYFTGTV